MPIEHQDITLRPVRSTELAQLTELCLRSKAVWGYDDKFMAACRAELTLTEADLTQSLVCVAERDGRPVGIAQLTCEGETAVLEKLFVEPGVLKIGIGRTLYQWAIAEARLRKAMRLTIDADPGAADFYQAMGARLEGETPSASIAGRMLPCLVHDLR